MSNITNSLYIAVPIEQETEQKNRNRPWLDKCEQKIAQVRNEIVSNIDEDQKATSIKNKMISRIDTKLTCIKYSSYLGALAAIISPPLAIIALAPGYYKIIAAPFGGLATGIGPQVIKYIGKKIFNKYRTENERPYSEYNNTRDALFQKLKDRGVDSLRYQYGEFTETTIADFKRILDPEFFRHSSLLFAFQTPAPTSNFEEEQKEGAAKDEDIFSFPRIVNFIMQPDTHQCVRYSQAFYKNLRDQLLNEKMPQALIDIIGDYTTEFGHFRNTDNMTLVQIDSTDDTVRPELIEEKESKIDL